MPTNRAKSVYVCVIPETAVCDRNYRFVYEVGHLYFQLSLSTFGYGIEIESIRYGIVSCIFGKRKEHLTVIAKLEIIEREKNWPKYTGPCLHSNWKMIMFVVDSSLRIDPLRRPPLQKPRKGIVPPNASHPHKAHIRLIFNYKFVRSDDSMYLSQLPKQI